MSIITDWPMDEGSGTTFIDHGSAANNATITVPGSPPWTTAAGFPGSVAGPGFQATAGSSTPTSSLFTGNVPFTITFWTDISTNTLQQGIFDTTNGLTGAGLYLRIGPAGDNNFDTIFESGAYPTGAAYVKSSWMPDGSFQFLAMVYNGVSPAASNITMYKNGVALGSTLVNNSLSSTVTSSNAALLYSPISHLGFFRIYDTALTPTDLLAAYAAGPIVPGGGTLIVNPGMDGNMRPQLKGGLNA